VDRLTAFLDDGLVPVLNAITHDGNGTLLNTNADTIASTVAQAMAQRFAVDLTFVIDRPGVLEDQDDPDTVIPTLSHSRIELAQASGAIGGGMLPKLENALEALSNGVESVRICGIDGVDDPKRGTRIIEDENA
jgi:acetylglutamate kinase